VQRPDQRDDSLLLLLLQQQLASFVCCSFACCSLQFMYICVRVRVCVCALFVVSHRSGNTLALSVLSSMCSSRYVHVSRSSRDVSLACVAAASVWFTGRWRACR
jgi:hypothetical protein